MKALIYLGPKRIEWQERPDPILEGPGEAVVRPIAAAACDLDARIVNGTAPFSAPMALGHECVARVEQVGEGVKTVGVGDIVVVPFQISCGQCAACVRGYTGNCHKVAAFSTYGFGLRGAAYGGVFADLVRVPFADGMLVKVPDGVDPVAISSLSDNITDGWRAVAPVVSGNPSAKVLVIGGEGCPSIGLYAAACAVALGAQRVDYMDTNLDRLQKAQAVGANAIEGPPQSKRGAYTLAVEASGKEDALRCALGSLEFEGTCCSLSIFWDNKTSMPLLDMYVTGVTFVTGRSHARPNIPPVLKLIQQGRLRPEIITSRKVAWSDLAPALLEGGHTKLVAVG